VLSLLISGVAALDAPQMRVEDSSSYPQAGTYSEAEGTRLPNCPLYSQGSTSVPAAGAAPETAGWWQKPSQVVGYFLQNAQPPNPA